MWNFGGAKFQSEEEKDAFYVVRKGDVIGVYKSLSDCQAQCGTSICHPPVSVYKGYGLARETEEYLMACGLKNPSYCINASYVKDDAFGKLDPCSLQKPSSSRGKSYGNESTLKRLQLNEPGIVEEDGSASYPSYPPRKHLKVDSNIIEAQPISSVCQSCTLEFDGASQGNPGPAGAGAVIRVGNGSLVYRLCEGLGRVTNNVAEYRALLLGIKSALQKGFTHIRVQGDSMLICMQVQDRWKTKQPKLAELCKQVKDLMGKFQSFEITHVPREFNSDADAQANRGIALREGEIEETCASN